MAELSTLIIIETREARSYAGSKTLPLNVLGTVTIVTIPYKNNRVLQDTRSKAMQKICVHDANLKRNFLSKYGIYFQYRKVAFIFSPMNR